MIALYMKEMKSYFISWVGFIYLFIFVLLMAIFYTLINLAYGVPTFQDTLSNLTIFSLVLMPVLTMRLFAEEAKHKTDQLIFTSPVSVAGIVLGKFLAALSLALIGMAITVIFPIMISRHGQLPVAKIALSYLGYTLLISCFISVGMFISAITDNQIIAAISTFFAMLLLYIIDAIGSALSQGVMASSTASLVAVAILVGLVSLLAYDSTKSLTVAVATLSVLLAATVLSFFLAKDAYVGLIGKAVIWISVMGRFGSFTSGIINVSDVVFCLSFAAAFIYLTINLIEKRRWK
ncbi:MAG: ABC transporter permease subunit [Clostridiales bacterium]|jgi:ABC-2 type transport system permease protein|nr:ABC transporter permease subunit [Clostridiales bacterium]